MKSPRLMETLISLAGLAVEGGSPYLLSQAGCSVKGYQSHSFVSEIHHCVVRDKGIHKADHVVSAQTLLLGRNLVRDDVQALVHLGKRRACHSPLRPMKRPPTTAPAPHTASACPYYPPSPSPVSGEAAQAGACAPFRRGSRNLANTCSCQGQTASLWCLLLPSGDEP